MKHTVDSPLNISFFLQIYHALSCDVPLPTQVNRLGPFCFILGHILLVYHCISSLIWYGELVHSQHILSLKDYHFFFQTSGRFLRQKKNSVPREKYKLRLNISWHQNVSSYLYKYACYSMYRCLEVIFWPIDTQFNFINPKMKVYFKIGHYFPNNLIMITYFNRPIAIILWPLFVCIPLYGLNISI